MTVFSQRIGNGANDGGSWGWGSTYWDTGGGSANFGNRLGSDYGAYLRFTGLTIANGATVSSSICTWQARTNQSSTTVNLKVGFSNEDSAAMPTSYADAVGRSYTATPADMSSVGAYTSGSNYSSGDFAASGQELFARAGWASGNNALVMVRNNGSSTNAWRDCDEYNDDAANAPLIDITYTAGGGGGLIPGQFLHNRAVNRASFF